MEEICIGEKNHVFVKTDYDCSTRQRYAWFVDGLAGLYISQIKDDKNKHFKSQF